MFDTSPSLYACAAPAWTDSTAPTDRACARPRGTAATTTECGFTYTGTCDAQCADAAAPFAGCDGGGTRYGEVITTFLQLTISADNGDCDYGEGLETGSGS